MFANSKLLFYPSSTLFPLPSFLFGNCKFVFSVWHTLLILCSDSSFLFMLPAVSSQMLDEGRFYVYLIVHFILNTAWTFWVHDKFSVNILKFIFLMFDKFSVNICWIYSFISIVHYALSNPSAAFLASTLHSHIYISNPDLSHSPLPPFYCPWVYTSI